jgi:hypothetical protein
MALRTTRAIAFGTAAIVILMAMTFAQGQDVQGAAPTAILESLGGMAQGLAEWFPGGPPVITLHAIDGKGPKDFGKRGKIFGNKFKIPLIIGQHSLTVSFVQSGYDNTLSTSDPVNLSFVAESDRKYTIECNVDYSSGRWIPFVVDRTDKSHPIIVLPPKTTSANPSSDGPAGDVLGNPGSEPDWPAVWQQARTSELASAHQGEVAFNFGRYDWAVRFLEQAKAIQSSGVWKSDYPFLAGSYFLSGKAEQGRSTLQDMLADVRQRTGYLSHSVPLRVLVTNLGKAREKLSPDQQRELDPAIDEVTRIK